MYRCWLCGVEAEMIEVTAYGAEPSYVPGRWLSPPTDGHEHADRPPTPGELLAAGARAFDRIMAVWA